MSGAKSGQKQEKKKTTKKVRTRGYGMRHIDDNMTKRAVRVYKRVLYFGLRSQETNARVHAEAEAKRCASAHGVVVEARLQRWLAAR